MPSKNEDGKTEETGTQLASRAERPIAAIGQTVVPGMSGNFGRQDLSLPIMVLTQPMSQDKGVEGRYYFPSGRAVEEMEVVVIGLIATRTAWADIAAGIDGPLCKSTDRATGLTRYPNWIMLGEREAKPLEEPVPIDCDKCRLGPSAQTFERDSDGLWCPFGYSLLLADFETAEPAIFFVKGMAFREVQSKLVSPALMRYQNTGEADPWRTTSIWTIKLVEEPGKKYYKPVITPGRALEQPHQDFYAAMSSDLIERSMKQIREDEPQTEQQEQPAAAPSDGAKQRPLPRN